MLEIDVTHLVDLEDCSQFSDSIANSGRQDIGKVTWENAVAFASEKPLVPAEKADELRDYFREFGAWSRKELAAMDANELNAMLLQLIAGDIQEYEGCESYEAYQAAAEAGQVSGNLYRSGEGPATKWFYTVSH